VKDHRDLARVLWCEIVVLALVATGDFTWWVAAAVLVLVPFVGLSSPHAPWRVAIRRVTSVTTILYLAFFPLDVFFLSGRLIFAIVHLTFYLMLHTLLHQESAKERGRLDRPRSFFVQGAASSLVSGGSPKRAAALRLVTAASCSKGRPRTSARTSSTWRTSAGSLRRPR